MNPRPAEYSIRMMDDTTPLTLPAEAAEPGISERFWEHVLGGIVLATVSFAVVLYCFYHGWMVADLSRDWAYAGIGFGFVFFTLGAFVFAYGWCAGDMQKTIRLTFFICLVMLATIIALLILLKSKGTAARGAADLGSAATSSDNFSPVPMLRAVASMVSDEAHPEDTQAVSKADETLFQITCRGCGATFAPVPPAAKCPYCGVEALSG
ncbi:MAG TPA: hypothetical protein VIB47_03240 [Dehalococcoidia bacterium]